MYEMILQIQWRNWRPGTVFLTYTPMDKTKFCKCWKMGLTACFYIPRNKLKYRPYEDAKDNERPGLSD